MARRRCGTESNTYGRHSAWVSGKVLFNAPEYTRVMSMAPKRAMSIASDSRPSWPEWYWRSLSRPLLRCSSCLPNHRTASTVG